MKGMTSKLPVKSSHIVQALRLPPKSETVTEWAEKHFELDSRFSAEHGKYNISRTPYLRQILDDYKDPHIKRTVFLASAQVGKTTLMQICYGWAMDNSPGPTMFVFPDKDSSEKFSRNRMQPLLDIPRLRQYRTNKVRDIKLHEWKLRNHTLYFGFAGSPASLASAAVRYVFLDETDKFVAQSTLKEADPISLAEVRTNSFPHSKKIVISSTPTVADGVIIQEYEKSDKRKYFVPCPYCGGYQVLIFPQIKGYDKEQNPDVVEAEGKAYYECEHCEGKITDLDKPTILNLGEWRRLNPETPNPICVGYYINALYSPWLTFSKVAAEFIRCGRDKHKLRGYFNSWLAEAFDDYDLTLDKKSVSRLATSSTRQRGELPPNTVFVTAGADWHGAVKGLYYSIWAWTKGGAMHLLDNAIVRNADDLHKALIEKRYEQDGRVFPIYSAIDSGDGNTVEAVYSFCRDYPRQVNPSKGHDTMRTTASYSDLDYTGKHTQIKYSVRLLNINTNHFKDILATRINDTEGKMIELYAGIDENFLTQMQNEKRIKKGNRTIWIPKYSGAHQHYLDTAIYAMAVAEIHRINDYVAVQKKREAQAEAPAPAQPITRKPQQRSSSPPRFAGMRRY
jgi:phage terminase large subunit GpA-like protein